MRSFLILLLHLLSGTVATVFSGLEAFRILSWALSIAGLDRPGINFEVNMLAFLFVPIGLTAGHLMYRRFGGRSALWVFVFPVAILLLRILTFPAPSIFSSGPAAGWDYFFGKVACSSPTLLGLSSSAVRCYDRMKYLGTVYSATAYSAGALTKLLQVFEFRAEQ